MHRRVKVLIARWLSSRMEIRTRRLRRALRDHQRAELRRIRAGDRRARGLRLYVAWSCKEEGDDELQNRRAIAAFIRCWGAGEQKRSLSPRSTTSQIVSNPQIVRANGSPCSI